MNITTVQYTDQSESVIEITFDNMTKISQPNNKQPYQYTEQLNTWLAQGNRIMPYIEPLELVQSRKLAELKSVFALKANEPVKINGYSWNGGAQSALLIQSKADSLFSLDMATGDLYDIDNVAHNLTIAQIKEIAAHISKKKKKVFAHYQAKKQQVYHCSGDTECISRITW